MFLVAKNEFLSLSRPDEQPIPSRCNHNTRGDL